MIMFTKYFGSPRRKILMCSVTTTIKNMHKYRAVTFGEKGEGEILEEYWEGSWDASSVLYLNLSDGYMGMGFVITYWAAH